MCVLIKWLAHSCYKIKAEEKVIYIDMGKYGEATEKADLVLITHSHYDHCDPDGIKKVLKEDTVIVAPKECAPKLLERTKTIKPGEEISIGKVRIRAVEAYNYKRFRSPGKPFHPKGFGVGYLITVSGKTIYHAGDTDLIPEMKKLGPVDIAMLPSGGTYTMDNEEAAEAAKLINPKVAIPMHRWETNPEEFKLAVEDNSKIKVEILKEGEEYQIT